MVRRRRAKNPSAVTGRAARTLSPASPFDLATMADAYPLDESEREAVNDLLEKLDRERAEAADQRQGDTSRGR